MRHVLREPEMVGRHAYEFSDGQEEHQAAGGDREDKIGRHNGQIIQKRGVQAEQGDVQAQ